MDVETVPPLDERERGAVSTALERAGVRLEVTPDSYDSAWRAAGLRDGLDEDEAELYALSPRSTRGATRA